MYLASDATPAAGNLATGYLHFYPFLLLGLSVVTGDLGMGDGVVSGAGGGFGGRRCGLEGNLGYVLGRVSVVGVNAGEVWKVKVGGQTHESYLLTDLNINTNCWKK